MFLVKVVLCLKPVTDSGLLNILQLLEKPVPSNMIIWFQLKVRSFTSHALIEYNYTKLFLYS